MSSLSFIETLHFCLKFRNQCMFISKTIGCPNMTTFVVKKLEQQLHFEAKTIYISDMDFDRISRFIPMKCNICKEGFESFNDCHEHYLSKC